MSNPETRLQILVVEYLRTVLPPEVVFWHVPNGGKMTEAQRMKQARMGELPGVADLHLLYKGQLHCIELKVEKNPVYQVKRTTNQSQAQKVFEARAVAAGGFYAVVRTRDELREVLTHWGIPTREVVK